MLPCTVAQLVNAQGYPVQCTSRGRNPVCTPLTKPWHTRLDWYRASLVIHPKTQYGPVMTLLQLLCTAVLSSRLTEQELS